VSAPKGLVKKMLGMDVEKVSEDGKFKYIVSMRTYLKRLCEDLSPGNIKK
jgi:hypothetical protein